MKFYIKFILSILLFTSFLNAERFVCTFEYEVMFAIASVERHPKRKIGYPFLISFNRKSDMNKIDPNLKGKYLKLDDRTIDCRNPENCKAILKNLEHKNLVNLDLGAFQINHRVHKLEHSVYFDLPSSFVNACKILHDIKEKHGWSWESYGMYHSKTEVHNKRYVKALKKAKKKIAKGKMLEVSYNTIEKGASTIPENE